jgi:hypothetical protein
MFAIADTALSDGWDGKPVPGLAPAAKQQGRYVTSVIKARLAGRPPPAPFHYRHAGSLATIGRKAAVADFGWLRLSGALAWWVWGAVHILFLSGMRNRVVVALEWFWAYLTYHPSTRLITGDIPIPTRSTMAPVTVGFLRESDGDERPAAAGAVLFSAMDIGDDEGHRVRTRILDPVLPRPEFGEYLAGTILLCRSVVMVIGQDSGEQVDDSRIALMAVQTDMTAWRYDRTAETQFAILSAVDLLGEIDRGEHVLADQVIVGGRRMLAQNEACCRKHQPCRTQCCDVTSSSHIILPGLARTCRVYTGLQSYRRL